MVGLLVDSRLGSRSEIQAEHGFEFGLEFLLSNSFVCSVSAMVLGYMSG